MEREMRMQQSANEVSRDVDDGEDLKREMANDTVNSFLLLGLGRDRAVRDRLCRCSTSCSVQSCGMASCAREGVCSVCTIFSALRPPSTGAQCRGNVDTAARNRIGNGIRHYVEARNGNFWTCRHQDTTCRSIPAPCRNGTKNVDSIQRLADHCSFIFCSIW